MRINQNISAMNTYSRLTSANTSKSNSLAKLSSGLRINKAGDDAAGLAISEKMRGQVGGLKQAVRNAQDGISLIQTAEGALNETHSILQRMRELAVQSSTDTNTDADRLEIQKEMDQLSSEVTRISNTTEFNTQNLLNGGITDTKFHIGANKGQNISLEIKAMDAFSLGIARDGVAAGVAAGATNIDGVSINGETDALKAGTIISVAAVNVPQAPEALGTITLGGVTVTTESFTDAYNDYQITVEDDITEGIAIDHENKTITITADIANGATASDVLTVSETGTAPAGVGGLVFSGTANTAVGTAETMGATSGATPGAAGNEAGIMVTLGGDQEIFVAPGTTKVDVTEGKYAGLSFTSSDLENASGNIELSALIASSAVFNADGTTVEAEAPAGINVSTQAAADNAIETIDSAIATVSSERSKLGSVQNRLDHTINNLTATAENLSAAESRIRDVDMAEEMMEFTKNNILSQAATAMLAQANQMPNSVLQLLQ